MGETVALETGGEEGAAPTSGGRTKLLVGGAVLLTVLGLSLGYREQVQGALQAFLDWSEGLGPAGPAVLVGAYILACVLFLPGSVLTLGAGAVFGLLKGFIAVSIGSTLGAGLAFLLGRSVARSWVEAQVARSPRLQALDQAVEKDGRKIVFLTRLSPVFPFNLLNFAFGATGVRFQDYLLASWVGMMPGTLMYVYLGTAARDLAAVAAGDLPASPAQNVLKAVGLVATIAVTVYVTRIARTALDSAIAEEDPEAVAGEEA